MLNRNIAPPIVDAVNFNLQLKPYQKFTLKNGVEVYSVHAGAEEVMAIEWVFRAGNAYEDQNLIAATANFLLKNGTSTKTAFQINEHFDYYGSYLNRACYNETATLSLHTLTRHLEQLLPSVRELLTDATLPQEELDIYRQNMKQRLKVSLKKADFVAGRLIDVYLFGEKHPYGKYSSAEDFDALQQEQVKAFYKKYYQQGKLIIFVSGRLPANLEELLNKYFGDLPGGEVPQLEIPPTPASEKKYRITNDADGVQGSIRLARQFPNRHHPDFLKVQVLNTLFGGFFGSRLMENIREDKGYTYGIHSYLQNHVSQSAWMVSTEAGRDVSEATIEEIHSEMKLLREEPVDDEELLLVRNYMMGSILGDLDGPFQIMARWKNIILNNLDEQYFYNSINAIKTVTAEELQALAQKYLNPEEFYELVVV
ncbi:insulinase family protein [Terrimonas sp. NA20]|uniref:Insulinase family protein n=1 Tax=Terrimonas ginsenosidimutans TaxID=2908004 RepID=A0ABS9KKM0_9BACT|nr:pitrilysin family protein [Terrimonas ginsenosidimutans]MCG2612883.1 insulinase family protein [Terrimonas ginsenosidimutans]